jgi:uncharacterized protein
MLDILIGGWEALKDYFTLQRGISLLIAFFLSGAVATFMPQGAVIKYFGPKAPKWLAYLVGSVSGILLAVCSCSILPMFASIRKKGAGIGPAITFLFAGPAINILAIITTFTLIGVGIGISRVVGAIILSILIGLIMAALFQKKEITDTNNAIFEIKDKSSRNWWQNALFFTTLIAILVSGVKDYQRLIITGVLAVLLIVQIILFFKKDELWRWCKETFNLTIKIIPLFIIGVFIAGIISVLIPEETMVSLVGTNSIGSNMLASTFGAFMYFATLTEVPIVNTFLGLGMASGPAVALLLAGPSLSLPNMIVIARVLKIKKAAAYIGLVIIFSSIIGLLTGLLL